jgi:hypothetical protein
MVFGCAGGGDVAQNEMEQASAAIDLLYDNDATDEEAGAAGQNRQDMLLVKDSWVRANQGEVEEAVAGFTEAGGIVYPFYLGAPAENLSVFWGRTLMMSGDADGAMSKFALDGLIKGEEQARTELRLAYNAAHGSQDG